VLEHVVRHYREYHRRQLETAKVAVLAAIAQVKELLKP
jgi:hypothetical protein